MRIKQRLAIILALCMLITALAPSAEAVGIWANRLNGGKGILRENVLFDLLDGNLFDLDLFQNDWDILMSKPQRAAAFPILVTARLSRCLTS